MSKAKGKDKKGDNNSAQHQLIQQLKRQILQQSFSIKRFHDKISHMVQQNQEITSTRDKIQQDYQQRIDKQRIIIEAHQNTIRQNRAKIYQQQVSRMALNNRIKDLQRDISQLQAMKNRQFDQYRRVTQSEITKLQMQLRQYYIYMDQRDKINNKNTNLMKSVQAVKQEKIRQVADKQRQKIQAVDRLRDQMLTKIKDMRSNLLQLKKQQLDTTTRLTVLQNHQLTSQLQFQSKQSQKLVFENEQYLKKINNLQKDLDIHKEIQEQLAKRSHYSRGIIKKLTAKIAQLQEALKYQSQKNNKKQKTQIKPNSPSQINKEQYIKTLDRSLENSQKKFLKLQSQAQLTKNQLTNLRAKIEKYQKKANNLLQLLFKAYQDFEQGNLQATSGGFQIDLSNLRKKQPQQWTRQQLKLVLNALIKQIAGLINRKTLNLPPLTFRPQQLSILDSDEMINNVRLPKISDHSTSKLQLSMKIKQLPISIGSKLVGSHVRDWGRTVHSSSHVNLSRKYKVYDK